MPGCAILLPAAGASQRMRGTGDKLLQEVQGRPLLRLVAERACAVAAHVAVTVPPEPGARACALRGLRVKQLPVQRASEGLAASLREGALWAMGLGVEALMVILPDMPEITSRDMRALIVAQARCPSRPLRASTEAGTPGHPVILPRDLLPQMLTLSGDEGARSTLTRHPPVLYPLRGARALCDLDTPEAWNAWRATTSSSDVIIPDD